MSSIKLKVCGMRDKANISDLIKLKPAYIGFIFYQKSKRNVEQWPAVDIPTDIQKVGVFVNEKEEELIAKVKIHQLDVVQLHGDETPEYCAKLEAIDVVVVKVFSVGEAFDFDQLHSYEPFCDFFLFDTKGKERGGNGIQFDWKILNEYHLSTPFFLSGGIDPTSIESIKAFQHPQLYALDVNSGFEIEPGLKNIDLLKQFSDELYS